MIYDTLMFHIIWYKELLSKSYRLTRVNNAANELNTLVS